jgi:hypothetical protein
MVKSGCLGLDQDPGLGREIWLSPVIQATWEARVVGRLEVERPLQRFGWTFTTALWFLTTGR